MIDEAVTRARVEGRVIISETCPGGERLINLRGATKRSNGPYFVLSRDLPMAMFAGQVSKASAVSAAKKWLQKTATALDKSGLRLRYCDYIDEMVDRYGVTATAARNAYKDTAFPGKGESGGRRDSYISRSELADFLK